MAAKKSTKRSNGNAHDMGALLESMDKKLDILSEGVVSVRQELIRRMDDGFKRVTDRIELLEGVVKQNSADIKQNSADIKELREELARLRHDFDRREDLARIAALETRVTEIERKLRAG